MKISTINSQIIENWIIWNISQIIINWVSHQHYKKTKFFEKKIYNLIDKNLFNQKY